MTTKNAEEGAKRRLELLNDLYSCKGGYDNLSTLTDGYHVSPTFALALKILNMVRYENLKYKWNLLSKPTNEDVEKARIWERQHQNEIAAKRKTRSEVKKAEQEPQTGPESPQEEQALPETKEKPNITRIIAWAALGQKYGINGNLESFILEAEAIASR